MALQMGLYSPKPPAGIIAYSSLWCGVAHPPPAPFVEPPPVLLVHGGRDEVIPSDALFASANALTSAGVPVQWHLCPELPHGIDTDGIDRGSAFLAHCLGQTPA